MATPAESAEPADAHGGEPDLAVRTTDIDAVASAAAALQEDLTEHGHGPEPNTESAAGDLRNAGASSGTALADLVTSWRQQCNNLINDCAHLSGNLYASASGFASQEEQLRAAVAHVTPTQAILDLAGTPETPSAPAQPYRSPLWDWPELRGHPEDA